MAGHSEPFDAPDDHLDELDLTEDEFDARAAAGEPVMVIGLAVASRLHTRLEDYYTLQKSDPRAVATSAGRWGGGPQSPVDRQAQVASAA
jgi:hypothetical protein